MSQLKFKPATSWIQVRSNNAQVNLLSPFNLLNVFLIESAYTTSLLFPAVLPYVHIMNNITSLFCLCKLIQKSRQINDKWVTSWGDKSTRIMILTCYCWLEFWETWVSFSWECMYHVGNLWLVCLLLLQALHIPDNIKQIKKDSVQSIIFHYI